MTEVELVKQVTDYVTSSGVDLKWIPSLLAQARAMSAKKHKTLYYNVTYSKQGGVIMTSSVKPITSVEESRDPKEEER